MYDLIIIGGGPAGAAAAVYAGRKKMKTLLLAESFGGQSIVSDDIENWIGEKSISGVALAKKLEEHVRAHESVEILIGMRASGVHKEDGIFKVVASDGKEFRSRALIVVTGARRRKLGVEGEETYSGRGVVYCSTCDAPLFASKTVAVVGGGNAGLEAVVDLLPYASKIYLLVRSGATKGDAVTLSVVESSPKVEIIYNAEIKGIFGDRFVKSVKYRDAASGQEKTLDLDGIFVEIGSVPNSDLVRELVQVNERGEIVVDHRTAASSCTGIWAAGDVSDSKYKQNNISVGDAVKAALSAYEYISKQKRD